MPAVSEKQREAAAIAEHHPSKATGAAKQMAKSMSKTQLHHFASTKGLKKAADLSAHELAYLEGFCEKCAGLNQDPEVILQKIADGEMVKRIAGGAGKGAVAGGVIGAGLGAVGSGVATGAYLASPLVRRQAKKHPKEALKLMRHALAQGAKGGSIRGAGFGAIVGGSARAAQ